MARYLALDLDAGGVTLAAGSVRGRSFAVEKVLCLTDEPAILSASTAAPLGFKLKELLKQAGIAPAPIIIAVGRDRLILKEIKHPPTEPQDEPAVVRFQAVKELTESPDELILDYLPLTTNNPGERKAMVVFLRRDLLNCAKTLADALGVKLHGVYPRPLGSIASVARVSATGAIPLPDVADATVATLMLNEGGGEFTVVKNGEMRFSRSIPSQSVGNESLLIGELRRNLTVYGAQTGEEIQAIYLAEAEAGLGAWAGRLADSLPVPVYAYDPLTGYDAAANVPPRLRNRFAGVVGLLANQADHGPRGYNFVTPRQPKAVVDPKRNRTAALALLALIVFAVLGLASYMLVSDANDRVSAARAKVDKVDRELKALEVDLKRLAAADEFENRQVFWLDELYDLAERYPNIDKMRLVSYVGTLTKPPTQKERQLEQQAAARAAGLTSPTPGAPPLPTQNVPVNQPPKPAGPKPAGQFTITVQSETPILPQTLVTSLASESKNYISTKKNDGTLVSATGVKTTLQTFKIEGLILHRPRSQYTRVIRDQIPKAPTAPAPAPATPMGGPGGFGAGFDGGPQP